MQHDKQEKLSNPCPEDQFPSHDLSRRHFLCPLMTSHPPMLHRSWEGHRRVSSGQVMGRTWWVAPRLVMEESRRCFLYQHMSRLLGQETPLASYVIRECLPRPVTWEGSIHVLPLNNSAFLLWETVHILLVVVCSLLCDSQVQGAPSYDQHPIISRRVSSR